MRFLGYFRELVVVVCVVSMVVVVVMCVGRMLDNFRRFVEMVGSQRVVLGLMTWPSWFLVFLRYISLCKSPF